MRAIWKGKIQFGPVDIPVKLYSAIEDISVHSHLLHDHDKVRLEQKMVCPEDEKVVSRDEMVKGYEVTTGEYVVIEPDELDFIEPQASRSISVTEFVDHVDVRYLDRTYYLGPDDDSQAYANMTETLKKTHLAGICQWVMRKKSYIGTLQFSNSIMTLTTHRYADEILSEDTFQLEDVEISPKEKKVANNIIKELKEKFKPEQYKQEYQIKLQKLIEQKAKGEKIELPALEKMTGTQDDKLLNALEESLKAIRK